MGTSLSSLLMMIVSTMFTVLATATVAAVAAYLFRQTSDSAYLIRISDSGAWPVFVT